MYHYQSEGRHRKLIFSRGRSDERASPFETLMDVKLQLVDVKELVVSQAEGDLAAPVPLGTMHQKKNERCPILETQVTMS